MDRDPVLDIKEMVKGLVKDETQHIHIGTDAQKIGKRTDFVTVLVVYNQGRGGRVFFTRQREPKTESLRQKLALETWASIEVAMALAPLLPRGEKQISVHIDANPNPRYKSSDYVKELTGMVMGQGFNHILKPYAWAASHAADHVVKNRHLDAGTRRKIRNRARRAKRAAVA